MTKRMKPLQQYFDQASERPLAFSEERLRDLLVQHDAPGHPPTNPARPFAASAWRVIGIGLVLAGLGNLTLDRSGDRPLAAGASGAAASLSTTTDARDNAPVPPQGIVSENSTVAPLSPRVQATPKRVQTDAVDLSATNRAPATALREGATDRAARIGDMTVRSLPVSATAALDMSVDDRRALGLRELADGRLAFGYYLVANLPKNLAPNLKLDDASLLGRGYEDSLLVQTIGPRGRSDLFVSRADFPLGIVTRRASPIASSWQVITDETGRLLEERVSVADADQLRQVSELFIRGAADGEVAQSVASIRGLDALGQSLRLNTLLPIRVTLGADAARSVFWCRPDPQLIAGLPARTVAQLRSELMKVAAVVGTRDTVAIVRRGWALSVLQTIDSIRPESLRVDSEFDVVPQGMTGAEIFAGSRRNAGAVVRFEPLRNPAMRTATFALELEQPRRITVTLHDVDGRRLKTLAPGQMRDEGSTEIVASLEGVERGLYLVSISTDRREQVVHRLVVE